MRAQTSRQLSSRSLRIDFSQSLPAVHNRVPHVASPGIVTAFAEVHRVRLAVVRHRHRCDVQVLVPFFPQHCLSHMNVGSWHPAELLTAVGSKLNSSLFHVHVHFHVVPLAWLALPRVCRLLSHHFLLSANLQHCSQNCGPLQKFSGPHRRRTPQGTAVLSLRQVQLHLQSFGSLTPSSDPNRPWTCQGSSAPLAPPSPL